MVFLPVFILRHASHEIVGMVGTALADAKVQQKLLSVTSHSTELIDKELLSVLVGDCKKILSLSCVRKTKLIFMYFVTCSIFLGMHGIFPPGFLLSTFLPIVL